MACLYLINNQLNSVCHITKDKITYDDAWHYIFEYIAEGTKQEFILCPVLTRDAIKLNNEKPVLDVASLQYEINKHGEPSIRLENITWEVNKEIVNFLKQYLNISIIFTENEDLFRFNVHYNPV